LQRKKIFLIIFFFFYKNNLLYHNYNKKKKLKKTFTIKTKKLKTMYSPRNSGFTNKDGGSSTLLNIIDEDEYQNYLDDFLMLIVVLSTKIAWIICLLPMMLKKKKLIKIV